jgi:transcriptional regulator with PAS, ATPase and Fis domain
MSTAKAALVEHINKRHLRGLPSRGRTPQNAERLKKIREMASELIEQASALEHEGELADANATISTLGMNGTIDFFAEVQKFEVKLIKRALDLAGGNQARAAKLLGLGTTTLNYKIKTYALHQG